MAHAPAIPVDRVAEEGGKLGRPSAHAAPVTPGKVAMWLFLATEIMFFTGLIGSYVVLRAGSPATAFSNLFPPATVIEGDMVNYQGVRVESFGKSRGLVRDALKAQGGMTEEQAEAFLLTSHAITPGMKPEQAEKLEAALKNAGATVELEGLKTSNWPLPYDSTMNPLSIDLTAVNTFLLICSSVTMVFALSAVQRGDKKRLCLFLLFTVLIGSTFLSVQVYEYTQLMFGHHYPIGISRTGHFTPDVSLFASCFFVMTGFHGAHVAGGVVFLTCILIGSLMGRFTHDHHSPVELAGLYWHFVDLVWIILFTVVYLV